MNVKLVLNKRKNPWGEYKIRYLVDGEELEIGSYYTDDWEDALITLNAIAKHHNTTVTKHSTLNLRTGKVTFINYQVEYESNIDVGD